MKDQINENSVAARHVATMKRHGMLCLKYGVPEVMRDTPEGDELQEALTWFAERHMARLSARQEARGGMPIRWLEAGWRIVNGCLIPPDPVSTFSAPPEVKAAARAAGEALGAQLTEAKTDPMQVTKDNIIEIVKKRQADNAAQGAVAAAKEKEAADFIARKMSPVISALEVLATMTVRHGTGRLSVRTSVSGIDMTGPTVFVTLYINRAAVLKVFHVDADDCYRLVYKSDDLQRPPVGLNAALQHVLERVAEEFEFPRL